MRGGLRTRLFSSMHHYPLAGVEAKRPQNLYVQPSVTVWENNGLRRRHCCLLPESLSHLTSAASLCDTSPNFHYHFITFSEFLLSLSSPPSPTHTHIHIHTLTQISDGFLTYANLGSLTVVYGDIKEQLLPGLHRVRGADPSVQQRARTHLISGALATNAHFNLLGLI